MTDKNNVFPLNLIDKIKEHPENYRLLEKIPLTIEGVDTHFPIVLNQPLENEKVYSVVFLDTETTGVDPVRNKVIELGMVKATFSLDRKIILTVDSYYDEFEDPKESIPKEIVELTHITDEMVQDKAFDDEMVARFLAGRPLIVAHNAGFDRPFFEKRFKNLTTLSWACSLKEVPWKNMGYPSAKLEFLNYHHGYFYGAHRAYVDCLALLWILYINPEAFSKLVTSAMSSNVKVTVVGNTFKFKDNLKEKGFRFDGPVEKSWSRFYQDPKEAAKVRDVLFDTYRDGSVEFDVIIKEYKAKTRYKLENHSFKQ